MEVFNINKKAKVVIGLISSLVLCLFGVYRLMIEARSSYSLLVPAIFAVTGFIALIANIIVLKKMKIDNEI
ncbi:hypothetical protein PthBH41_17170 [Parageobacillus thermoglucosidasius]|nr:hypothetical protein PthBH41_17170 [Parageobacillus thermoglucosidasius]GAJ44632.1 hypothetical protein GT2_19_00370 [Parageobacillus thermoglucosidasius NBRC 107763]